MAFLSFHNSRAKFDSFERNRVMFIGHDGVRVVECYISVPALERSFGMRGDPAKNALATFEQNRVTIERVAAAKYIAGPVTLTSADFEAGASTQMTVED